MYRPTRTWYLGARPTKKAMEQIRQRVSEILWRGRTERWNDIGRELNRYLTGWARYLAYDTAYPLLRQVDLHMVARARNLLKRRHKLQRATARFDYLCTFSHGSCQNPEFPDVACLRVKSAREPDAGKPHVQFDERRGGNGHMGPRRAGGAKA